MKQKSLHCSSYFLTYEVKLIRHLNTYQYQNSEKVFEGIILNIRNPTVNIFIPDLFWSDDFHIADLTNNRMNYDDNKKTFYNENLTINEGMIVYLKIKKIKVAFLDIEFEVNKI